ncbi:MAG: DUF2849 domain-containing protein [Pikeienuella sp.]
MPRSFQLQVLTANDLVEGDSVFLTTSGWGRDITEARVAQSREEADLLAEGGKLEEAENRVVGSYLVAVTLEAGVPVPVSRRERIRAAGVPTFPYAPAREVDGVSQAA